MNIQIKAAVCHSALDVENPVVRAESRFVCGYSEGDKNEIAALLSVARPEPERFGARNDRNKHVIARSPDSYRDDVAISGLGPNE